MAEQDDDVALIRRWFRTLQVYVQTVDFVGSRPLFADDMITFGTFTAFTIGREATEQEQWRHVWGHIDQFRWRLDDLRTSSQVTASRRSAWQCSNPPAIPKTARRLIGQAAQWLCSGDRLSARSGWPSTPMCRCFQVPLHAPSAPRRTSRLLYRNNTSADQTRACPAGTKVAQLQCLARGVLP
jgi:hypothetical protein